MKDRNIFIEREVPGERKEIYQVVKKAFESAEPRSGREQDIVEALKESDAFIPELSLVAKEGDKIVGYILFTKVRIGKRTELSLSLLGVLPEYRSRGIGLSLIEEGHRKAKNLGFQCIVVVGHAGYYPKKGYLPAASYGIKAPFPVPDENFMVFGLDPRGERVEGIVEYPAAFGIQ